MKHKFKCGHIGKGRFCHLCRQIDSGELTQIGKKYYTKEQIKNDETEGAGE